MKTVAVPVRLCKLSVLSVKTILCTKEELKSIALKIKLNS